MESFVRFLVRRRVAVLAVLAVVTVAFAAAFPRAQLESTLEDLFFGEDPDYERYLERIDRFASDEFLLFGYEDERPLDPDRIAALERALAEIEAHPEVRRVESLLTAQRLLVGPEGIDVRSYVDEARARPGSAAALVRELATDERLGGLLVSPDARHLTVLIEFVPSADRPAEMGPAFVSWAEQLFHEAGVTDGQIYRAGPVALVSELVAQSLFNMTRLMPVTFVLLFLMGLALFRQLWPVLLTQLVAALGCIWTMGFGIWWLGQVNIFMSMAPVLIAVLSFSDVVHLASAYLLELASGRDKEDAIVAAVGEVGRACLFTSITTAIGFLALAVIPTPVMRQFGILLGFGVAVTLGLAITLVPVVLSFMPAPAIPRNLHGSGSRLSIDGVLRLSQHLATERAGAVVVVFVLLLIPAGMGLARMEVDTSFSDRFSSDNPVSQGLDWFERSFGGTDQLALFVDSGAEDGALDPGFLERLATFQDRAVAEVEGVDRAGSVVDLYRTLDRAFRPGEAAASARGGLPETRAAAAQYLLLYEVGGGTDVERVLSPDRRAVQMLVRLEATGVREEWEIGKRLEALGAEVLGPDADVEAGSVFYFLGGWVDTVVASQKQGLGLSVLTITALMIVGLRSVRVGLLSMIPNLVPLAVFGGVLGWAYDKVDTDNMAVAMVAIGIAVDDTIHFLARFRTESDRAERAASEGHGIEDPHERMRAVLERTFHFAGRAIVMTTVILFVGFAPLAFSDYLSIFLFGTLLPATLVVALACDLLLLPALVRLGVVRFR